MLKCNLFVISLLSLLFFISGCTNNKQDNLLSDLFVMPKSFNDNQVTIEPINQIEGFEKLATPSEIDSNNLKGKNDPFSNSLSESEDSFFNQLQLIGLMSNGINKIAIVKYFGESGELTEGAVGGKSTKLIPNGYIVDFIDIQNEILILTKGKEKYEFKLWELSIN